MKIKYYLPLIFIVTSQFLFAQQKYTIEGVVFDATTGEPKKNVKIVLENETFGINYEQKVWYNKKRLKKKPKKYKKYIGTFKIKQILVGDYNIKILEGDFVLYEDKLIVLEDLRDIIYKVESIDEVKKEKEAQKLAKEKAEVEGKRLALKIAEKEKQERALQKEKEWVSNIYNNKMNYLMSEDSVYKYLDNSILDTLEPEMKIIFEKSTELIDGMLSSKIEYTERKKTGYRFNEEKYQKLFNFYKKEYGTEWAADEANKLANETTYSTKTNMGNRVIAVDNILDSKIPKWTEIVKYAGGYSQLTSKGIRKDNINSFKLTYHLKSIEIVDKNEFKAIIKISGEEDAIDFYKITNNENIIEGKMEIPKLNYFNMDILEIHFPIELYDKISIPISKIDGKVYNQLKEDKSNINIMFNDLVSETDFNNALKKNSKTIQFSKENWILNRQ